MLLIKGICRIVIIAALIFQISMPCFAETRRRSKSGDILKDTILGAGIGAISAEASGGKAGKGALVGAGANVFTNLLFDSMAGEPEPEPQPQPTYYYQVQPQQQQTYVPAVPQYQGETYPQKTVVQQAYEKGYEEGYRLGYRDGLRDGKSGY